SRMIIAYCLSFFLAFVFLTLFRKKASNLSNRFQTSRINVQNILSQAWDNVLLGNSYSLNLWKKRFYNGIHHTKKATAASEGFNHLVSSLAMVITMVPVLGTMAWLIYTHRGQP